MRIAGLGAALALAFSPLAAMELARDGEGRYAVRVADAAAPAEKNAAEELALHLRRITGAGPRDGDAPHVLHVGLGAAQARLPDFAWDELARDELVVQPDGDDLVLAGGPPRGTLYAVYEFLERDLGVRWWTSTEDHVPERATLRLDPVARRYRSPFRAREALFYDSAKNPRFAARLRQNGHHAGGAPQWGGKEAPLGFVHTMVRTLVTKDKFFVEHPEYFALVGGRRTPTQLCLANAGARAALVAAALEKLRAAPDAAGLAVSQEDNESYCRCPDCAAFDQREGSPAGILLDAVNEVARAVEKEFPGVWVETLAYQYTQRPPKTVRPHDNVVVRLCSMNADAARPLDAPANARFFRDLEGWSRIAPRLAMWDYVANYANYFLPHPTLPPVGPNLRLLLRHNVVDVLVQGDHASGARVGDVPALKNWVISQLLWNPERDADALVAEFLDGYYGAAAPHLAEYLSIRRRAAAAYDGKISCYAPQAKFLAPRELAACAEALRQAGEAVAGDAILAERVRLAALPVELLLVTNYQAAARQRGFRAENYPAPDIAALAASATSFAREKGALKLRWNRDFADAIDSYLCLAASTPPPPRFRNAKADPIIFDVQDTWFRLEAGAEAVDDDGASDGRALRLDPASSARSATREFLDLLYPEHGVWRLYVFARGKAKRGAGGAALRVGSFHKIKKNTSQGEVPASGLTRSYRVYDAGAHAFGVNSVLFAASAGNAAVEELYIDRVIMVREAAGPYWN